MVVVNWGSNEDTVVLSFRYMVVNVSYCVERDNKDEVTTSGGGKYWDLLLWLLHQVKNTRQKLSC